MLNEQGNLFLPDLNTVLFGIATSDFNTNHRIMITVQKYLLDSNSLNVEDGFSLSLSLSLSHSLSLSLSLSLSVYMHMYNGLNIRR